MTSPPFIMIGTLLFWGACTGLIPVALIMALPLELSRRGQHRWDFDDADFNRVADICAVIIVGLFVYFFSTTPLKALYAVGKWLPLAVYPLIAVQKYSTRRQIRISALIWMLRRAEARGEMAPRYVDLTYPYIAICVIAAGFANTRTAWYYIGVIFLTGWILFPLRSKRYPAVLWVIVFFVICVTGFGAHTGMHAFQKLTIRWYYQQFMKQSDPLHATTAIGDIGDLKPSGRIDFRVRRTGTAPLPKLLIDGVYNLYSPPEWVAVGAELKAIAPGKNSTTWPLVPGASPKTTVTVAAPLKRGEGMLKLPVNTIDVIDLPVAVTRRNRLGAVAVEGGPGLVIYKARTGIPENIPAPDRFDLQVPTYEKDAIRTVVDSLGLEGRPPEAIVTSINDWFKTEFTYSLKQRQRGKDSGLSDFLLHTRSGHCEYFATATVLLLRASGIPSRYITGFGLPEISDDHKNWIAVRDRHAHAWAAAFINGKWLTVDTTPPSWREIDEENASIWEPLYNRLSDIYFAYAMWRWSEDRNLTNYLLWMLVPMILYLGRSLFRRRKKQTEKAINAHQPAEIIWPGTDSPFYMVEQALLSQGYDRFDGEPLRVWLTRIKTYLPDPELTDRIMSILTLHYKYRFDPSGLSADQKNRLVRDADNIRSAITSPAP